MPVSLDGKLVVAISSRAVFDFEEENRVFERDDDAAYMALQRERLDQSAPPGVAFALMKKLLAFDSPDTDEAAYLRVIERKTAGASSGASGAAWLRMARRPSSRVTPRMCSDPVVAANSPCTPQSV